jgi:hypothetical protein
LEIKVYGDSSTGSGGVSLNAADLKHNVQYASFYMHVRKCPMKKLRGSV